VATAATHAADFAHVPLGSHPAERLTGFVGAPCAAAGTPVSVINSNGTARAVLTRARIILGDTYRGAPRFRRGV
jgi:hypothetical protein